MPEKRYQVFVSSTYEDLKDARQQVIQALLELDCFPAGMELFSAANEDQWTLITEVIDQCDYYIVIIAGRYGSTVPDGMSYTEKEYRHALAQGKPIIAFLHKDPGTIQADDTEKDEEPRKRLATFRELAEKKVCKYWSTPVELGSVVSRSVINLTKRHPAVGWVRADQVATGDAAAEILRLRRQVDELEKRARDAATNPPPGTDNLAKGEESFAISFDTSIETEDGDDYDLQNAILPTWNDLFALLGPRMLNEASEHKLHQVFSVYARDRATEVTEKYMRANSLPVANIGTITVESEAFHTVLVQFRALGLITHNERPRSVKDQQTYWTLTPYGDTMMTRLRAVRPSEQAVPRADNPGESV